MIMGEELSVRMNKIILLTVFISFGIAIVGILIVAVKSIGIDDGPEREMVLTLGWNGEQVAIPAPVKFPEWGKKTWEFRLWRWKKDSRTFTTFDRKGYKYVAQGLGFVRDKNGRLYGAFSGIKRYGPDGKLEASTTILSGNVPEEWMTFNEQGKKAVYVYAFHKDAGTSYEVIFYGDDGKMVKEWYTNTNGVVYSEQVRGPDGRYHFTHRMKELKDPM